MPGFLVDCQGNAHAVSFSTTGFAWHFASCTICAWVDADNEDAASTAGVQLWRETPSHIVGAFDLLMDLAQLAQQVQRPVTALRVRVDKNAGDLLSRTTSYGVDVESRAVLRLVDGGGVQFAECLLPAPSNPPDWLVWSAAKMLDKLRM